MSDPLISDVRRDVVVNREFYAQLMQYLKPTERWMSPTTGKLILFSFDFTNGQTTALYFIPEKAV